MTSTHDIDQYVNENPHVAPLRAAWTDAQLRHSIRFRTVSTRYPRRVAEAYDRDIDRAAADTDEQVAQTVAAWERANGVEPRDWHAIGAAERGEEPARPVLRPDADDERWQEFCEALAAALGSAGGCDGGSHDGSGYTNARQLLAARGFDVEASLALYAERGGYCDCEILWNVYSPV